MPYNYKGKPRKKHGTFRTHPKVLESIDHLCDKISENKFYWKFDNPIRECANRSGLIHNLLAENITIAEIRRELKKREAENESN